MKISLIGDSIRMQYTPIVKEMLGDKFEIFTPEENCRFAKYNLRGMWDWKEGMKGSRIVHWNAGLWDICDIFGDGMFTSVEEYVSTMLRIADILTDTKILMQTQELARELMEDKDSFKREENRQIARLVSKKINSLQVSNTANTI